MRLGRLSAELLFAHAENIAVLNKLRVDNLLQTLHLAKESTVFQSDFAMALLFRQEAVQQGKLKQLVHFIVLEVATEDRYLQLSESCLR